jgi:PadR family transcriptional regulator PadR
MSTITPLTYDILLALADAPRHGYGIIKEIESRGSAPSTGAMYLALQRMERDQLIEEAPERPSDVDDGRRRYYRITPRGRELAEQESIRLAGLLATARAKDLLPGTAGGGGRR